MALSPARLPLPSVINLALPFFGLIFAGVVAAKLFHIEERAGDRLNVLVLYFALPAMIYRTVSQAPFEQLLNWPFIVCTTAATCLVFAVAFANGVWAMRAPVHVAGIQASAASYGNIGYMGLVLAVAAFGEAAVVPAILVFCFDNIVQFTLVPLTAAIGTTRAEASRGEIAFNIVRSIVSHPFIVATAAGAAAAATGIKLPTALDTFLEILSRAAAPAALFALGITVAQRRFSGVGREFPLLVTLKVLFHPFIVLVLLGLIGGFDPLWIGVAVLMASLPTAANVYVFADQYGAWVEGASSTILVTTVLSALTVPALLAVIDQGLLPYDLLSFR